MTIQLPKLLAFDLDDTLAPSKSPLPQEIKDLLVKLLGKVQVAVISGGNIEQFQKQLLTPLTAVRLPENALENLHVLPTCGTHYEIRKNGSWQTVYRETLPPEDRESALTALHNRAIELGLWEPEPWGEILEDRGSQVTFSALGQEAPVAAKSAWDPDGSKKNRLAAAVQQDLPHLEVRSGGSTSVDITRRGIDKAYGMQKLSEHTRIPLAEMLFIGDRLDPAGNDYPVLRLGVPCRAVTGWQDTAQLLHEML